MFVTGLALRSEILDGTDPGNQQSGQTYCGNNQSPENPINGFGNNML